MPPPPQHKTKAEELQRIRQNQQRSRQRKRAYVDELEGKVRQLGKKLQQCGPCDESTRSLEGLARENDARRELLRAMGVDDAAQQHFIQTAAKRDAARVAFPLQTPSNGSPDSEEAVSNLQSLGTPINAAESASPQDWLDGFGTDWQLNTFANDVQSMPLQALTEIQSEESAYSALQFPLVPWVDRHPVADSGRLLPLREEATPPRYTASSDHPVTAPVIPLKPATPGSAPFAFLTASEVFLDKAMRTRTPTYDAPGVSPARFSPRRHPSIPPALHPTPPAQPPLSAQSPTTVPDAETFSGPCLQNTVLRTYALTSQGTTACSTAFSMLFQHNIRGYSTSELEARLQAGYRKNATVAEGCMVVNKVLFQLLAEIS